MRWLMLLCVVALGVSACASASNPSGRPASVDPAPAPPSIGVSESPRPDSAEPTPTTEPAPVGEDATYPIVVPAEVAARSPLPWCGHEIVHRRQTGDFLDGAVRECFLAAYGVGEPAEFVSDAPTIEGARWRTIYRAIADGTVELYLDSTADPLSSREWTRTTCDSLEASGTDPGGVPHFEAAPCADSEVVSDVDGGEEPSPDELSMIERLAAIDDEPDPGLEPIPFADEVVLGLANRVLVVRAADELSDPAAWLLNAEAFRGYVGPFSAVELLRTPPAESGVPVPWELQVVVGSHPHCASPPVAPPAEIAELRRVSVQPARPDGCLAWWTVDLFLNPDGRIAGVTLDLWEP